MSDVESQAVVAKRGRGRPRTKPVPDPDAPKKPRGRPRKYQNPEEQKIKQAEYYASRNEMLRHYVELGKMYEKLLKEAETKVLEEEGK